MRDLQALQPQRCGLPQGQLRGQPTIGPGDNSPRQRVRRTPVEHLLQGGEQRFMFSVLIGLIAALAGEGRRRGNCRNNTYARTGAGPGPVIHLPGLVTKT